VEVVELYQGKEYAIQKCESSLTVKTEALALKYYDFVSSDKQVFKPFTATMSTRF